MKNDVLWAIFQGKFHLYGLSYCFMKDVYGRVIGSRRYSAHLALGGLEIPCVLTFNGNVKLQYVTIDMTTILRVFHDILAISCNVF